MIGLSMKNGFMLDAVTICSPYSKDQIRNAFEWKEILFVDREKVDVCDPTCTIWQKDPQNNVTVSSIITSYKNIVAELDPQTDTQEESTCDISILTVAVVSICLP